MQSTDDNTSTVSKAQKTSSVSHSQPPATYYKDKYKHLLGVDSGKDAARATKSNSAYGYGEFTSKDITQCFLEYSRLPIIRTFKGNRKKFELSGVRVIEGKIT